MDPIRNDSPCHIHSEQHRLQYTGRPLHTRIQYQIQNLEHTLNQLASYIQAYL